MSIQIRSYDTADTEKLLTLFHDTVRAVNGKDYSVEQLDGWAPVHPDLKRWRERLKSSKTYVAETDGKIVGFGNLENDRTTIGMLYVHKDYQGMGIASMLLNKLEGSLEKKGVKISRVESSITARTFFEQKGYRWIADNNKMLNGKGFLNFILEKNLSVDEPADEKAINEEKSTTQEKPAAPRKEQKAGHSENDKKERKRMKDKSKKKKSFRWSDLFIHKVFDLLIVIAGVTIAFQLNNLKVHSDGKKLERFYLENLSIDLEKDIHKMEEIIITLQVDDKAVKGYLPSLDRSDPSADSLARVVVEVLGFETFQGNQDTYNTLLGSNGLTTLADPEIRNRVTEYYKQYIAIVRFEKVYTDVLYRVNDYFYSSIDYSARHVVDIDVLKKVQTKNVLLMALSQITTGMEDYAETINKAKALQLKIQAELKAGKE